MAVWDMVAKFYNENGTTSQFTSLCLTMLHDPTKPKGNYPKLKGRGAEVKGLVPALRHVWERCHNASDEMHSMVLRALVCQCEMQSTIDDYAHEFFFPPEVATSFRAVVDRFLNAYSWLGAAADRNGDLLWSMVPQIHWLWHLAFRSQYLHPRRGACLLDEDFVGKIKRIVQNTTASKQLHLIPAVTLEKWRWGKHIMNTYNVRL